MEKVDIDLVSYLPSNLRSGEVGEFMSVFENWLNGEYFSTSGYGYSSMDKTDNLSAYPSGYQEVPVSILEKIKRLVSLRDPSLIDLEYVKYFSRLLGYEIEFNRDDIHVFSSGVSANSGLYDVSATEASVNNYIRNSLENSPWFNKMKSTKSSLLYMLYSFGVVGHIIDVYTKNYLETADDWITFYDNEGQIYSQFFEDGYFPSPHFKLAVDLSKSSINWASNIQAIVRTVDSIKPVHTVFHGLEQYFNVEANIGIAIGVFARNGYSKNWIGVPASL